MRQLSVCAILLTLLCSGCVSAYYLSPFNSNSQYYHAIPLLSDSIKSATYAGGNISIGSANDESRDNVFLFNTSIHRSHTFNIYHAWYGADFSIGNYGVTKYINEATAGVDTGAINSSAGNKFFGGYGLNGGIDVVVPFSSGAEWRVIGLEASYRNEFGNYLLFRKNLPYSAATIIDKNNSITTLGVTTDVAFKPTSTATFGFKLAYGHSIFSPKIYIWDGSSVSTIYRGYEYFTITPHFTLKKYTGFVQLNFGNYATNIQGGFHYRLGKK